MTHQSHLLALALILTTGCSLPDTAGEYGEEYWGSWCQGAAVCMSISVGECRDVMQNIWCEEVDCWQEIVWDDTVTVGEWRQCLRALEDGTCTDVENATIPFECLSF